MTEAGAHRVARGYDMNAELLRKAAALMRERNDAGWLMLLADWLDVMAAGLERTWKDCSEFSLPEPYMAGLAVANAYLGED